MKRRSILSIVQIVLALCGAAVAYTLYWAHSHNFDLPCSTGNGCDLVNESHWARLGSIPVSLLGAGGYAVIAIAAVLKLTADKEDFARGALLVILALTTGGFFYSWYLQYVAHVFIGALCIYCLTSAFLMTLLFLSAVVETVLTVRRSFAASIPVSDKSIA